MPPQTELAQTLASRRKAAVRLIRRIDEALPRIEAAAGKVAGVNALIDRRAAVAFDQHSAAEYEELCARIDRELAPIRRADAEIREVATGVQSFLHESPVFTAEWQVLWEQIGSVPLLAAASSALPWNKEAAVGDCRRLRVLLVRIVELAAARPQEDGDGRPAAVQAEELLTVAEVAKELGVSRRTLDRWSLLRKGPTRTHVGRKPRYSRAALNEWLRSPERVGRRR